MSDAKKEALSDKVLALQKELKPYLMTIINHINAEDSKGAYIACNLLADYLKVTFPTLKGQAELNEVFRSVRIDCGISIQNVAFSEACMEAFSDIRRENAALVEEESSNSSASIDEKIIHAQHAIIGLGSCIALTMDADTYKSQSLLISEETKFGSAKQKQFDANIAKIKTDISTMQPELLDLARNPKLMKQAVKAFIGELAHYQSKLPASTQDRTLVQNLKYSAVETAILALSDDLLTAQRLGDILVKLDTDNQEAETFTNIFSQIWKALFGAFNRLGHTVSDFKERLLSGTQNQSQPSTPTESKDDTTGGYESFRND